MKIKRLSQNVQIRLYIKMSNKTNEKFSFIAHLFTRTHHYSSYDALLF